MRRMSVALSGVVIASLASMAAHAGGGPHFAVTLPFRDCAGLICIEARVNGGKPLTLALDTGDIDSIMLADSAKAQNWQLAPIIQDGKPLSGMQRSDPKTVALDGMKIDVHFVVLDRKAYGGKVPPVDGTLAYTVFKNRMLQIDYPHHLLRISDVITSPDASDRMPGTLQLITFGKQGPPIVVGAPFTVNGHSVHAQIDTMYTGTLLVYDAALDKLGLHKHGTPTLFDYTDGGVEMLAAPAQRLGFANQNLLGKRPTIYFAGRGKNPVHQPDGLFEATVGNALFTHSVVTMDFHAMKLDIRPAG